MKTLLVAFLFIVITFLKPCPVFANAPNLAARDNTEKLNPINPQTNATASKPVEDTNFATSSAVITLAQEVKGRLTQEQAELIAEAKGRAFFLQETADALRNSPPLYAIWGSKEYPDDFLVIAEALFNIRAVRFELISDPKKVEVEVTVQRSPRYNNLQEALKAGVANEDYLLLLGMALTQEINKLKEIEEKKVEALLPSEGIPENVLPLKTATNSLQAMALFRDNLRPPNYPNGPLLVDIDKNMRRAESLDPWSPLPSYLLGNTQLKMGNASQAIAALTNSINQNPNFSQALLARGTAYLRLSLVDLAIHDFNDAVKLRPNNPTYYMARASAFLAKKDFIQMCNDFKSACSKGECEGLHWGVSRGYCK